jgi:hypothetical protein
MLLAVPLEQGDERLLVVVGEEAFQQLAIVRVRTGGRPDHLRSWRRTLSGCAFAMGSLRQRLDPDIGGAGGGI